MNYEFWKPYIESFGYYLPYKCNELGINYSDLKILLFLTRRYIKKEYTLNHMTDIFKVIPVDRKYSIYCGGKVGKICIQFFQTMPVEYKIVKVYDDVKKTVYTVCQSRNPCCDKLKMREEYIIVATLKYKEEIEEMLNSYGLNKREDYYAIDDLCLDLLRRKNFKRF